MPVSYGSWTEASALHLGFALISTFFVCLLIMQLQIRQNRSINLSKAQWALTTVGVLASILSWALQINPAWKEATSFSRSIPWWLFLSALCLVTLYWHSVMLRKNQGIPQEAQNALIQEQLLLQSVTQIQQNLKLQDEVRHAKRINLRSQMNPHFLFNILTGIQHLLFSEQSERASHVFRRFRKLLMKDFISNDRINGALSQELEQVKQYMELEKERLSKTIQWTIKLEDGLNAQQTSCPLFILQPLVENAIWHGLSSESIVQPQLLIQVIRQEEDLLLMVHDNGIGLDPNSSNKKPKHQSRGTAILKERLSLLRHPGALNLSMQHPLSPYSQGTSSEIRLPLWALEPPPHPTRVKTANEDSEHH
jgi:sensor histidine kinase YesM